MDSPNRLIDYVDDKNRVSATFVLENIDRKYIKLPEENNEA
jgi:hypothetical protein